VSNWALPNNGTRPSVLALSREGEHFKLAADLAEAMQRKGSPLKRWTGRGSKYARDFEMQLGHLLDASGTFVEAVSAKGAVIANCFDELLKQLRLESAASRFTKNGKPYLKFGPFTGLSFDTGTPRPIPEPIWFELPETQAIPLIFICHFLIFAHQRLMPLIQSMEPGVEWIDWQLTPNKFPGDINGPMAGLFSAIVGGAPHARLVAGSLRVFFFNESKQDAGSILADNVAGMLAKKLINGNRRIGERAFDGFRSFSWQIWEKG
jgi:hypothetical protein